MIIADDGLDQADTWGSLGSESVSASLWLVQLWLTKPKGYAGLGASVTALGLASTKAIEIDLVVCGHRPELEICANSGNKCASLGAVNSDLVRAIYNACEGNKPWPPPERSGSQTIFFNLTFDRGQWHEGVQCSQTCEQSNRNAGGPERAYADILPHKPDSLDESRRKTGQSISGTQRRRMAC